MPTLFDVLFYVFGVVTVIAAVCTCFVRNIVHAAFSLMLTFFGVAGIYVMLSADFLAVSQILIYVGGVMVLLVFGVMLTNRITNIDIRAGGSQRIPVAVVCAALLFILVSLVLSTHWITNQDAPWSQTQWNQNAVQRVTGEMQGSVREVLDKSGSQGTSMEIGKLLLTDYLLPFELVSVVLLVALIGAAMIARKEPAPERVDDELLDEATGMEEISNEVSHA